MGRGGKVALSGGDIVFSIARERANLFFDNISMNQLESS